MSAAEVVALLFAAAAAGAINSVAGGGTLITFPVLLLFGISPVTANATSTLALMVGTGGSLFGYRRHLAMVRPWLSRFIPVSLAGGLLGSVLLTHTSNATFGKMVPFLILFATVLFLAQGAFRRFSGVGQATDTPPRGLSVPAAIVFQFGVAIYGGYFGAGIGILMLASLGFIGLTNIYEMNALKTVLGSLINLVAALWFVSAGLIDWPRAGVMTIGTVVGYFLGAHYAQRISQRAVRIVITAIGFLITVQTFVEEFLQ